MAPGTELDFPGLSALAHLLMPGKASAAKLSSPQIGFYE